MNKREFLKVTGVVGAGIAIAPFTACHTQENKDQSGGSNPEEDPKQASTSEFILPALGFAADALAPRIDAETMNIHYGKHHAGYVKKLNKALNETQRYGGKDIAYILGSIKAGDIGIRNNGGGHFNHSLYWKILNPGGGNAPTGVLNDAMISAFGDYANFSDQFFKAAKTRFGSGWAWMSVDTNNKLFVSSTPNQDNPMMTNIVDRPGTPILGIDVWEHAYYLNYQNRRGDYINAFMELINWDQVAANFSATMA